MKKGVLRGFAVALVAAVLSIGLVACGAANDEEVIRAGIKEELDLLKNPTEENISEYMGDADTSDFASIEEAGIDVYEMLSHMLGKFEYSIGDITVDGSSATAAVTVSNVDVEAAVEAATEEITSEENVAALTEAYNSGDESKIMDLMLSYIYASIDNSEDVVTTNLELTLTKDGNEWNIDETSLEEFTSAVFGGIDLGSL